ncbi:MAG: hypothetical protein K8R11_09710 [Methanococcoides sp.]|nr:hypothetical protein [Methanococcoides sp.]
MKNDEKDVTPTTMSQNENDNNSGTDNKVYNTFYSDEVNQIVKIRNLKEYIILIGQAGSGKSWELKQRSLEASKQDRYNLTIVPQHNLADEYIEFYNKNDIESVKLMGHKRGCMIHQMQSLAKKGKRVAGMKELLMLDNAPTYVKCMEMVAGGFCDGESCDYKPIWKQLRNRQGEIKSSCVIPAAMQGVVDIDEFNGEIIIDENCGEIGVIDLKFDVKDIMTKLNLVAMEEQITKKKVLDYVRAVKNLDVMYLIKEEYEMEGAVSSYNNLVLEKYCHVSFKNRSSKYLKINFKEIRMICEFTLHQRRFDEKDIKFQFDNKVEKTLSDVVAIKNKITDLKKQIETYIGLEDEDNKEDVKEAVEDNNDDIGKLLQYRVEVIEDLLEFMKEYGYDINKMGLSSFFINEIEDDELIRMLSVMCNVYSHQQIKSNDYHSVFLFNEILMWQHYHCIGDKKIHCADTTFESKQEYWIHDLLEFKKLFTDYNVKCTTVEMKCKEFKPTLMMPKISEMFGKTNIDKSMYNNRSHFKNLIKNNKSRNNAKAMVCTHADALRNVKKEIKPSIFGCDAIYMGSSAGVNKYEENDLMVNIGTYMPPVDWYKDECKKKYPEYAKTFPWNNMEFVKDNENRTMLPTDDILRELYLNIWQMDVYNLICRCRPFNKQTTIIWYGWNCPQRLIDESNQVFS